GAGTYNVNISQNISAEAMVSSGPGRISLISENGRAFVTNTSSYTVFALGTGNLIYGFHAIAGTASAGTVGGNHGILTGGSQTQIAANIVDQNGHDVSGIVNDGLTQGNEVFSSGANSGAAGTSFGLNIGGEFADDGGMLVAWNNVHDCWGNGASAQRMTLSFGNIFANCAGDGLRLNPGLNYFTHLLFNTFSG